MNNVVLTRIAEQPDLDTLLENYLIGAFVSRFGGQEQRYVWEKYDTAEGPSEYHHIVMDDGEPVSEWYRKEY